MRSVREAVALGLRFLQDAVDTDGAWPARRYANRELAGPGSAESPPFVAGLGLLALRECDDPVAARLRLRTRTFLHACMDYPGVWRYWPRLPPDVDDTAICSLAAGPHLWLLLARNVELLLACRDRAGRFRTWMAGPEQVSAALNPVDSVVNANVVAYLGDRPETRAAQRWLATLVADGSERDLALRYYPDPIDLYVALARARSLAPPVFARLRPALTARILSCRQPEGRVRGRHAHGAGADGAAPAWRRRPGGGGAAGSRPAPCGAALRRRLAGVPGLAGSAGYDARVRFRSPHHRVLCRGPGCASRRDDPATGTGAGRRGSRGWTRGARRLPCASGSPR